MKCFLPIIFLFFLLCNTGQSQSNVAVWGFKTRNGKENQTTKNLTLEFEEALAQSINYNVLERRNSDQLLAVINTEKSIKTVQQLSSNSVEALKKLSLDEIIFGEVYDDISSGDISVTITFEKLNGQKLVIKSILMRRGLIFDQRSRRSKMLQLVQSLQQESVDEMVEQTLKKIRGNLPKDPSELKAEDIKVFVRFDDYKPILRISKPAGLQDYDAFYSLDKENYKKNDPGLVVRIDNYYQDQLYVKFVSKKDQTVIGPFEKKGEFSKSAKEYYLKRITQDPNKYINCKPGGCQIDQPALCFSMATALNIGTTRNNPSVTYPLDPRSCQKLDPKLFKDCLAPPKEIFSLYPGKILFCSLEYADGYEIPFEIKVYGRNETKLLKPKKQGTWIPLIPTGKSDEQPYAEVTLNPHMGENFRFFLGAGGCAYGEDGIELMLFDTDGKGLIEAENRGSKNEFSISDMKQQDVIKIAADLKSGERIGPFEYQFDVKEVIKKYVLTLPPPKIEFSRYGGKIHARIPLTKFSIINWWEVDRIAFGSDQQNLDQVFKIDINERTILENQEYYNNPSKNFFRFDIPKNWSNAYYQILFKNGTKTKAIRYPIQK